MKGKHVEGIGFLLIVGGMLGALTFQITGIPIGLFFFVAILGFVVFIVGRFI